jgi:hypothetical protein
MLLAKIMNLTNKQCRFVPISIVHGQKDLFEISQVGMLKTRTS